jgi:hypothetical protein
MINTVPKEPEFCVIKVASVRETQSVYFLQKENTVGHIKKRIRLIQSYSTIGYCLVVVRALFRVFVVFLVTLFTDESLF